MDYWATNDREAIIALDRQPTCETCQRERITEHVRQCEAEERRKNWIEMIERLQDFSESLKHLKK